MYYLLINNERSGPFSADEVRLYIQKGAVGSETHFWRDGMMEWQTIGSSRHLFEPQTPPTVQYQQPEYGQPQTQQYQPSQPQHQQFQQPQYQLQPQQQINYYQPQPLMVQPVIMASSKSRVAFVLLGLFLGGFGVHNFYAGYAGRGVAQLLLNLFLFWTIVVPVIIGIWVIIEVIAVDRDANGYRFT